MKFFNTAGPVNRKDHYTLDPLKRINLQEILTLIEQKKYFVLHAPRQTGKTSSLYALMDYLNKGDEYTALYINVEAAQAARENVDTAVTLIVDEIFSKASIYLPELNLANRFRGELINVTPSGRLGYLLANWAKISPRPLILLIDEIDALVGDTLISVLRQIRAGYSDRPHAFPQSILLCGLRDVKDYRIHSSSTKEVITGGSAFNIKAVSLRLGDFTEEDIRTLYLQHTKESGQKFEEEVYPVVWEQTHGQPWLVNALAYEACFKLEECREKTVAITAEHIRQVKENLIQMRETHLDQLSDKLKEDRVKRVIAPMLQGENTPEIILTDDIDYCIDLGLIRRDRIRGLVLSNAIYQEVIPRELTYSTQLTISQQTLWYVSKDNRLDMNRLFTSFQDFFMENSEIWLERFDYKEAGPQLLLQAFLQRIINGGGRLNREYGLGRLRTDLFIEWPLEEKLGFMGEVQKVVIELKIERNGREKTIEQGLPQTLKYRDRCLADSSHLVIFNRNPQISWESKIFHEEREYNGQKITVWGM